MPESDVHDKVAAALIEVAKVRYAAFRKRFGRDPEPHEPLLFDPEKDEPTAATWSDRRLQVLSAALASNVDAIRVLDFLGFRQLH
jgi:hypothetical protein